MFTAWTELLAGTGYIASPTQCIVSVCLAGLAIALLVAVAIWKEKSPARQITGGLVLVLLLLRLLLIK